MPRHAELYSETSKEKKPSVSADSQPFDWNMLQTVWSWRPITPFGLQRSLPRNGIINITVLSQASKAVLRGYPTTIPNFRRRVLFQGLFRVDDILGSSLVILPQFPLDGIRNIHRIEAKYAVDIIHETFVAGIGKKKRPSVKISLATAQDLVSQITGKSLATIATWYENYEIMIKYPDSYFINPLAIVYNPRNKDLSVKNIEDELFKKVSPFRSIFTRISGYFDVLTYIHIIFPQVTVAIRARMPITTVILCNSAKILHHFAGEEEDNRPTFEVADLFCFEKQAQFTEILKRYETDEGLPRMSTTWLRNFMEKYRLSYKVPSNMTKHSYASLHPSIMEFVVTYLLLATSGLYDADLIINADQSPSNRAYNPGKVIGLTNTPTHVNGVSGEKSRVTAMYAATLTGLFLVAFLVGKSTSSQKIGQVHHYRFDNPSQYQDYKKEVLPAATVVYPPTQPCAPVPAHLAIRPRYDGYQPVSITTAPFASSGYATTASGVSLCPADTPPVDAPLPPSGPQNAESVISELKRILLGVIEAADSNNPNPMARSLQLPEKRRAPPPRPKRQAKKQHTGGTHTKSKAADVPIPSRRHLARERRPPSRCRVEVAEDEDEDLVDDAAVVDDDSDYTPTFAFTNSRKKSGGDDELFDESDSDYSDAESDVDDPVAPGCRGFSSHPAVDAVLRDTRLRGIPSEKMKEILRPLDQEYKTFLAESAAATANSQGAKDETVSPDNNIFVTFNKRAWFNSGVMLSWLERVVLPRRKDPNKRILLLIDCCSLHRTAEVRAFCLAHKIDVLFIPPNCTGLLQPMDIGINRIMKDYLRKFTVGRIFYEYDGTGQRVHDARYLTEHRYQCALLSSLNQIAKATVVNSFHHMVFGARVDPAEVERKSKIPSH